MIQRFAHDSPGDGPAIEHAAELVYVCKAEAHDTQWPRALHNHDHVEIVLVVSGEGAHVVDGRCYQTCKGDLLIYNSGALHDETAISGNEMAVLCCAFRHFKLQGLPANCLTRNNASIKLATGEAYRDLISLFELLYAHTGSTRAGSSTLCAHLLQALLIMVLRLLQQDMPAMPSRLELGASIQAYIDQHYRDPIDLASIAHALKLSPWYLTRRFKAYTGYSPIQYMIRRRLGEAQSLLINSTASVADIALAVGYDDPNYFCTAFKKAIGVTPGHYRRQYLE